LQLRRITSGGTWIPQIDGLRFIAIVSVLIFHVTGQLVSRSGHVVPVQSRYDFLLSLIGDGDRGVQLFFVISGYILARPFLRQHRMKGRPVGLGAYFLRRLTRLEPPYVLALLIYTAGFAAFGLPLRPMLPHLAASMAYLHNIIYHQMSTIDFVTWSLEIEVQFYILAPVLGLIYLVPGTVLRRSVLAAAALAGGALNLHPSLLLGITLLGQIQYFLTGFLLADILEGHQTQGHRSPAWDVVSLVGWPIIFLLPRGVETLSWLPIVILPVYLAAFYGPASNWFFRRPLVALSGGMCYSLYLMHMFIISVCFKATRHLAVFQDFLLNWMTQVIALGGCIALFGTIYFVLIERPCMDPDWPQKAWLRLTHRKSVVAG